MSFSGMTLFANKMCLYLFWHEKCSLEKEIMKFSYMTVWHILGQYSAVKRPMPFTTTTIFTCEMCEQDQVPGVQWCGFGRCHCLTSVNILNTKNQIFSYKTFNYLYHMDTFVLVILCLNVVGTDVTRLKVVLWKTRCLLWRVHNTVLERS